MAELEHNQALGKKGSTKSSDELAEIKAAINRIEKGMNNAAELIKELLKSVYDMGEGIQIATHGSHVGAPQCTEALNSVIDKCKKACELLGKHYSNTVFTHINAVANYGLKDAAGMIEVTPEINRVRGGIDEIVEQIAVILSISGMMYQDVSRQMLMAVKSTDAEVFCSKFGEATEQYSEIYDRMKAYSDFLSYAYDRYHNEQEDAIIRALSIPK